jgi:hypothetical protein
MSDLVHRGLLERRADGLHLLDLKSLTALADAPR